MTGDVRRASTKQRLFPLVIVLLLLALTACGSDAPTVYRLDKDDVVLAFGNSITFGSGAEKDESYPARLAKLIDRSVTNAGVPGEVSSEGLARLPGVLGKYPPALLILCHGGNDMLRQMDEKAAADNIRRMVKMAKDAGVDVVLIGVPRPGLFVPYAADFYLEIAEEFNIPYDEKTLADIALDGSLQSDPIHPNAKGYDKLARSIAKLLKEAKAF